MNQEWQDIATAPKDGTKVLLYWRNQGGPVIMCVDSWDSLKHDFSWFGFATHWMPLPSPPA